MPTVLIDNKRVNLAPKAAIGKGGEADVYRLDQDTAVKLWKQPQHPDLQHNPQEQAAARQRLREHQDKMPAFPQGLPGRVIAPRDLALDKKGRIVGYTMRLVPSPVEALMSYGQRRFRQGIETPQVVLLMLDLAKTVQQLHDKGVVIGDFNDLNELVHRDQVWLIDADSFQFDKFLCRAYTAKFLDPLLSKGPKLQLDQPHTPDSDWYSYAVMLLQALLFVGPYGGVYRPQDKTKRCTQDQRPLRRITIFDPEVRYPKFGVPWAALSDDLLDSFQAIFQRDTRGAFPIQLLNKTRWTHCNTCDLDHAQRACPVCAEKVPVAQLVQEIRGNLTITTLLELTEGQVVYCSAHRKVEWVVHHNGGFERDGKQLLEMPRHGWRVRIHGDRVVFGRPVGNLAVLQGKTDADDILVDNTTEGTLAFDTNSNALYYCSNGTLYWRPVGQTSVYPVGQVLQSRTRFWVGEKFGLGYYRAGEMVVAFVFAAERRGINDQVELPELRGHLVGARAYFSGALCWLLTVVKGPHGIQHHLAVVDQQGRVRAFEVQDEHEGWLGGSIHGKVAIGKSLYCCTDDGLVRVDMVHHGAEQTRAFPDTEPYCDESCELLPGPTSGIVIVRPRLIQLLEMA